MMKLTDHCCKRLLSAVDPNLLLLTLDPDDDDDKFAVSNVQSDKLYSVDGALKMTLGIAFSGGRSLILGRLHKVFPKSESSY